MTQGERKKALEEGESEKKIKKKYEQYFTIKSSHA